MSAISRKKEEDKSFKEFKKIGEVYKLENTELWKNSMFHELPVRIKEAIEIYMKSDYDIPKKEVPLMWDKNILAREVVLSRIRYMTFKKRLTEVV